MEKSRFFVASYLVCDVASNTGKRLIKVQYEDQSPLSFL